MGQHLVDDVTAVLAWQIEVQEDQVRRGSILMVTAAKKKINRFNAIAYDVQTAGNASFIQCFACKQDVTGIIFNQQYLNRLVLQCNHV